MSSSSRATVVAAGGGGTSEQGRYEPRRLLRIRAISWKQLMGTGRLQSCPLTGISGGGARAGEGSSLLCPALLAQCPHLATPRTRRLRPPRPAVHDGEPWLSALLLPLAGRSPEGVQGWISIIASRQIGCVAAPR